MMSNACTDPLGHALLRYLKKKDPLSIIEVGSPGFDADQIPVPYLFRGFEAMPEIEQRALKMVKGTVLDIGPGAGAHGFSLMRELGLAEHDWVGLEQSPGACEAMKQRGLAQVLMADVWDVDIGQFADFGVQSFETILLLMNGIGIAGTLSKLPLFLTKVSSWLSPGGEILMDSSDLKYLYDEDLSLDKNAGYYGEISYQMRHRNHLSEPFSWIYVDYETLRRVAADLGLGCEKIMDGPHHDYLARLFLSS